MTESIGLYVHIPFCATKCPYCDFYSVPYQSLLAEKYINTIVTHMKSYHDKGYIADTLYFGGGTPSLMKPEWIERIIQTAKDVFSLKGEITIEANPNSVSLEKCKAYKQAGVNRISFGMQSNHENELSALGRTHKPNQVETAICFAREAGIFNISLDLMLGTPYQTLESVSKTLAHITTLPITHISAYMLKIEPNTPFYNSAIINHCGDEDLQSDIYLHTVSFLENMGFAQYEISNFSKVGFESLHNLKYWNCEDYIGFGASAHSHLGTKRFYHPNDIDEYIFTNGNHILYSDTHSNDLEEYVMLQLRLKKGLAFNRLVSDFGVDKNKLLRKAEQYEQYGLGNIKNDYLSLTPQGFLISNTLISDLLNAIAVNENSSLNLYKATKL
ncbi:radical SAM family heme chaperone HemW [Paludicola sp. MB14-C6]|uniref:radical SAM family heme chaperone HemW n=1 Tax=Paludihabitans sp. MB14-C6 TaxID=3070656 RepID=UPI0027DE853F|nr:radical SAM family heme chaperone HemW [Paludicola sp. MB14-C6]WMJ22019.1 radical SAM family heme chaperone HemW [Paludicola sp. MB14-C6]